jgi:hypothetical protein
MQQMMWFTGVVEDRADPAKLGRVRVRIFGLHTDDTTKIATVDLPWSNVMMPVNSASISGVGISPTGLVEGSWVVGFFADGQNAQDPIIIGSLPSKSTQPLNELKAFKDPDGKYPRWFNETDVSKNAREETWKDSVAYTTRYGSMVSSIEMATAPKLSTVQVDREDANYSRNTWNEPEPRDGIGGLYPYVHTYESEMGIVREYDDTPQAARIHEFHPSGSYYEIYPDGTRAFKVTGDNFEIVVGDENILVRGSRNVTIEGNATHLVKGNYTMEVMGNYNLKVHGERNTKITQNESMEILGNCNVNIKEEHVQRVGKNQTLLVDLNKTETIGGTSDLSVTGATSVNVLDTYTLFSNGNQTLSTNASQQILSKSGLNFDSDGAWTLRCNSNIAVNASGNITTQGQGNVSTQSGGNMSTQSGGTTTMNSSGAFTVSAPSVDFG